MTAKGIGGQITVTQHSVIIERNGGCAFFMHGFKGTKEIPYRSITAVQFKKAGLMEGYLQISVKGGLESGKGITKARRDENTIMFAVPEEDQFRAVKDHIMSAISGGSPEPTATAPNLPPPLPDFPPKKSRSCASTGVLVLAGLVIILAFVIIAVSSP